MNEGHIQMSRTKNKKRHHVKVTSGTDSLTAQAEFADPEDAPAAETIADLKEAAVSKSQTKGASAVKNRVSREWTTGEKIRFKWGIAGAKSVVLLARIMLAAVALVMIWMVVIAIASSVVPMTVQVMSTGTGVSFESPLADVVIWLILPALFLNGLLLVLTCVVVKKIWQFQASTGDRIRDALVGER